MQEVTLTIVNHKVDSLSVTELDGFEKPANPTRFLLLAGLAVLIVSIFVYAPTRSGAFLADDWIVINQLTFKYPTFFDNLGWFGRDWGVGVDFYRPWIRLGYYFQFLLFGSNPAGWHLVSVLLHSLNSLLVFGLGWRISRRGGVGLLAGLLFALLPIHSEPVSWISGQTDLWAALWCLASAFCFVSLRQLQREGRNGRNYLIGSVVCFGLALLSKEVAVALPLALLFYDFVKGGLDRLFLHHDDASHEGSGTLRRLAITHAPFWLLLIAYIILRLILFGGLGGYTAEAGQSVDISLFLRTNLKWLLMPASLSGPDGLIVLGAIGSFLALTFVQEWERFRVRMNLPLETAQAGKSKVSQDPDTALIPHPPYFTARTAVYGFLWTALFLLPTILTAPAERFTYLPSAGFALFFGSILAPFGSDYKLFKRDLSWRERWSSFFDLSTLLRVITIIVILFTYLATTNSRVSNWLLSGQLSDNLLAQTKKVIPDVVNYSVFISQGVPEAGADSLIFRTGYPEAIQLLYKNSTVESQLVKRFPIEEDKLGRTIFLEYQGEKIINRLDIREALQKRNELAKNQTTFQLWDFSKPLGSVGAGGSGTWFENSGTGRAEQRNGALVVSASGEAVIQSPDFFTGGLSALKLGTLEITMKVSARSGTFRGQVTWLVSGTPSTNPEASTSFEIIADGQDRTYRIRPTSTAFYYDDIISRITLRLPAGVGEVEILKIEQKIIPPPAN